MPSALLKQRNEVSHGVCNANSVEHDPLLRGFGLCRLPWALGRGREEEIVNSRSQERWVDERMLWSVTLNKRSKVEKGLEFRS